MNKYEYGLNSDEVRTYSNFSDRSKQSPVNTVFRYGCMGLMAWRACVFTVAAVITLFLKGVDLVGMNL